MTFTSSTKQTLFIHVGMNKTGSTALQSWLSEHRKMLNNKYGLLYPQTGLVDGVHYGISDALGFQNNNKGASYELLKNYSKQLAQELRVSNCEKACISSENFALDHNINPVHDFFSSFDCKIIIYLRRHDFWYESAYNQAIKMLKNPEYQIGIESFIEWQKQKAKNFSNYRFQVDRWGKIFGKKNVIVRPYENEQMPKGIVDDFLQAIGIQLVKDDIGPVAISNRSLSKASNYILSVAQRSDLTNKELQKVINFLELNDSKDTPYSLLSPQQRLAIIEENQQDYKYIAQEYLSMQQELFFKPLPDKNEPWQPFVPPEQFEVISIIVKALR